MQLIYECDGRQVLSIEEHGIEPITVDIADYTQWLGRHTDWNRVLLPINRFLLNTMTRDDVSKLRLFYQEAFQILDNSHWRIPSLSIGLRFYYLTHELELNRKLLQFVEFGLDVPIIGGEAFPSAELPTIEFSRDSYIALLAINLYSKLLMPIYARLAQRQLDGEQLRKLPDAGFNLLGNLTAYTRLEPTFAALYSGVLRIFKAKFPEASPAAYGSVHGIYARLLTKHYVGLDLLAMESDLVAWTVKTITAQCEAFEERQKTL